MNSETWTVKDEIDYLSRVAGETADAENPLHGYLARLLPSERLLKYQEALPYTHTWNMQDRQAIKWEVERLWRRALKRESESGQ